MSTTSLCPLEDQTNLLIDELPNALFVNGESYEINTSFRNVLMYEELIGDRTVSLEEKVYRAIMLFYKKAPIDLTQAIEQITKYYTCNAKEQARKVKGEVRGDPQIIYSYEHDARYIYAAFKQQYGVDLATEDLHWWQFKAMFDGLTEDTQFKKILEYRAVRISSKMTDEQKEFYREMKKIYALPSEEKEYKDEQRAKIAAILSGDGNLSKLRQG